jgi:hypothetical protein
MTALAMELFSFLGSEESRGGIVGYVRTGFTGSSVFEWFSRAILEAISSIIRDFEAIR